MPNLYRIARMALFCLAGSICCCARCPAQSTSTTQGSTSTSTDGKPRVKRQDSVTVTANYTPEEKEDDKINETFMPIFAVQQQGDCETAIRRYQSEVIPVAEQSKFEKPKNKFLYLANQQIGFCYMKEQHFSEAEKTFQMLFQYASVWPGKGDLDYAQIFSQVAAAQMGLEHWEAAEDSLKKSLACSDSLIDAASKSNLEFERTEGAANLRALKARPLAYLAIVYFRERRAAEALKTADVAYESAIQSNVAPGILKEVVTIGRSIATSLEDSGEIAKWSKRDQNN